MDESRARPMVGENHSGMRASERKHVWERGGGQKSRNDLGSVRFGKPIWNGSERAVA